MAERYIRLVTTRVAYYHKFLPLSTRRYYEMDDMISEVVLRLLAKSKLFDATKAKEITWVWCVVDNQCKSILDRYCKSKSAAACLTVEMTPEIEMVLESKIHVSTESKAAVERVISVATDRALDLLDDILNGKMPRSIDMEAVEDLRLASRHCGCRYEDYLEVYRYVVA